MADQTGIDIKITTTANLAGAKGAAQALGEVNVQATKGAAAAQAQGKAVNELGESFDKGAAAGRVLGEVARGNVLALGQLGAALKAIGTLLRTNLIGGLITLGALAATVLLPLIKGFQDKKKAADAAGGAIDANRQKMEELANANKAAIDRIVADAALAADAYAELAGMIDAARRRQDELADAALAAKIAEIDAAEQLALANAGTDEERSLIRVRFGRQRADARSTAEENRLANDLLQAGLIEGQARAAQDRAREEIRAADSNEEAAVNARDVAASQLAGARESGASAAVFEAFAADYLAAVNQLEAIRARSAATRTEQGPVISRAQADLDRVSQTRDIAALRQRGFAANNLATAASREAEERALMASLPRGAGDRLARAALGQVRNPVDLDASQEEAISRRALELNRNALAQEGRQAGETIGEALGLALKEAFPEVSNAILSNLRSYVDQAIRAESTRIESQIRALRN
jgi:hypothetical protein